MKKITQKPQTILFTKEGYEEFATKKILLLQERPAAVEDLAKARAMGDLSENGYYKSARAKLSFIDREIRHVTYLLQHAKIKEKTASDIVDVGVTVVIFDGKNEKTYTIVGGYESNPSEGKISYHSPLGKALIGKKIGDEAKVVTPSQMTIYKIISIS